MPVLNEGMNLGDVLKYEGLNLYSRETVTVLAGDGADRVMGVGTIIGRRTKSDAVADADPGNTGDGTLDNLTLGPQAVPGVYRLTCIEAAANGGIFQAVTPQGHRLPDITVGQPHDGDHLKLTLSDGAVDFVVGDTFTVTISGDGKVTAFDPAAVDGTADPIGVMARDVAAPPGNDIPETAILRHAILADHAVIWPEGITVQQKDDAIAALEARGILIRTGA